MREVPTFGGMVPEFQSPKPENSPKKKTPWKRDLPPASELEEGIADGVKMPEEVLKKEIEKHAAENLENQPPAS